VGAQWKNGPNRFALSAFASRYGNYIALLPTGSHTPPPDDLPEYAFSGVKARFVGLEASGTVRLWGAGTSWLASKNDGGAPASALDLDWRGDWVRATNTTLGEPLPLIAPLRVGATLRWTQGPWAARLGFNDHAAQNRLAAGQLATKGYTLWNAGLTWRQDWGPSQLLWYAQIDNLSNRLAYSASSVLTQTAAGKAPLPGRSAKLGLQVNF
jgi:iron complex outermembrane receptor protein